ncbi:MAG TPA: excalibur calcium-binding domain-containing protein [Nitrososphaeraceae archaeon]|nr:excalibur calcium-binding domain-containing protein [Nitrososphaeraceae archaeon]
MKARNLITLKSTIILLLGISSIAFFSDIPTIDATTEDNSDDCDSSYPDTCIPSPPNLNCKDISEKRFEVEPPDPHGFDRDGDGIGCES